MKKLISENTFYTCSCQQVTLSGYELRNHLKVPLLHVIKPVVTEKTNIFIGNLLEKNLETIKITREFNQDFSLKLLHKKIHKTWLIILFMNSKRPFETIKYISRSFRIQDVSKITFYLNPKTQNLLNFLNLHKIKEITQLKHEKIIFKLQFKLFSKKHSGLIECICFSSNEKYIITGGADSYLRIFNSSTLENLKNLCFHISPIKSIDIDPKSLYLLSCSMDHTICITCLKYFNLISRFVGHQDNVSSVVFINSRYFISGSIDKFVKIWDLTNKKLVRNFRFECDILKVWYSREGVFNVVCFDGFIGEVWMNLGIVKKKIMGLGIVTACKFSQEFNLILNGLINGQIQVIQLDPMKALMTIQAHTGQVLCIDICKYSRLFVSTSIDLTTYIGKVITWEILRVINTETIITVLQFFNGFLYTCNTPSLINCYQFLTLNRLKESSFLRLGSKNLDISVKQKYCVYGYQNKLCVFDLNLGNFKASEYLDSTIAKILLFKSIIICGTSSGRVYYLDIPSLETKRNLE